MIVIKVFFVPNLAPCHESCGALTLALIVPSLLHAAADLPMRKMPWYPWNGTLDNCYQ